MSQPTNETAITGSRRIELTESERHRLLSVERRRLVLDVLTGKSAPIDIESLAGGVAAREEGLDASEEETIQRVSVELHHIHLPLMTAMGVLEYDPDAGRVDVQS